MRRFGMRWLLIMFLALALMLTAAACEEEEEEKGTPTASPAATAQASPVVTPTAEETPAGETGGVDGFRAFAQQIEAAIQGGDAAFFAERARLTELTCTGEEFPLPCAGEPAGTTLSGIPSNIWQSDASALLSPEEYAGWLERYFGAARDDLSDDHGSGSLTFYALARSEAEGNQVFRAITTSIVDTYPSGGPLREPAREAHLFNFEFENGRWQFTGEKVATTFAGSLDWLSGECSECYDHWEHWEGAAP